MENQAAQQAAQAVQQAAQQASQASQAAQSADSSATSALQILKECLQTSLEVLKSVRATLTDADDIKDFDVRIAETRARLAVLEDN